MVVSHEDKTKLPSTSRNLHLQYQSIIETKQCYRKLISRTRRRLPQILFKPLLDGKSQLLN